MEYRAAAYAKAMARHGDPEIGGRGGGFLADGD